MNLSDKETGINLLTQFSGRLPEHYDWRLGNHPDYDRFFRYLDYLAADFDVTVFSTYPVGDAVRPSVNVVTMDRPRGPGTVWFHLTKAIARLGRLSAVNWEEVCSANAPSALLAVIRRMRQTDVFFSYGAPERAWLLNWMARLLGKIVVHDNFDDYLLGVLAERYRCRGAAAWLTWHIKTRVVLIVLWVAMRAAHIVTGSTPAHREWLRHRYGIRDGRITLVRPTVNEAVAPEPGLRARIGIEESDLVVVYAGNFSTLSNQEALRFVQDRLASKTATNPRIKYLILGRIPQHLVRPLANVVYAGFVRNIGAYLKAADIGLSPVWTAGGLFEIKVIQYLQAGLPVICAAERGNRFDTDAVRVVPIDRMAQTIVEMAGNTEALDSLQTVARDYYAVAFSNRVVEDDIRSMACRIREIDATRRPRG